jgi:uncharacterized membrane protein required for colicin V production
VKHWHARGLANFGMINWYDIVVVGALFYGVWSGISAGLTGEIIRLAGLVLMIVLASEFHQFVGDWLHANSPLTDDAAQAVAFIGIAVMVYLITLAIRLRTAKRMQELKVAALLENVGGGFAGAIRVVVIMAWITVVLSLSTSSYFADQVGIKSRFGSLVLDRLPEVRAAMNNSWFSPKASQPTGTSHEESSSSSTQHLETISK